MISQDLWFLSENRGNSVQWYASCREQGYCCLKNGFIRLHMLRDTCDTQPIVASNFLEDENTACNKLMSIIIYFCDIYTVTRRVDDTFAMQHVLVRKHTL